MKNGPHNSMIPNQNFSRGNNIQTNFKTNPLKIEIQWPHFQY